MDPCLTCDRGRYLVGLPIERPGRPPRADARLESILRHRIWTGVDLPPFATRVKARGGGVVEVVV